MSRVGGRLKPILAYMSKSNGKKIPGSNAGVSFENFFCGEGGGAMPLDV